MRAIKTKVKKTIKKTLVCLSCFFLLNIAGVFPKQLLFNQGKYYYNK